MKRCDSGCARKAGRDHLCVAWLAACVWILCVVTGRAGLEDGLVVHYTFATDQGLVVTDVSGNERAGTVSGASWNANGVVGGAMSFDGEDDEISIAHESAFDFELTNDFSVAMWIRASVGSTQRVLVAKLADTNAPGWEVRLSGGDYLGFRLRQEDALRVSRGCPSTTVSDGTWHLWTFLWEGSSGITPYNLYIFRDTEELVACNLYHFVCPGSMLNDEPVRIGGNGDGWHSAFTVDGFRIYDRVLSANEIAALRAEGVETQHVFTVTGNPAEHGQPTTHDYGVHCLADGRTYTNTVDSPVYESGAVRHVCTGWTGGGDVSQGNTNVVVFTATTNSTLVWQWQTENRLETHAGAGGAVDVESGWHTNGSTVTIDAAASNYYHFAQWDGDVAGGETTNNPLVLPMDGPKTVTARFAANVTTNTATPEWWLAQFGWTSEFPATALLDPDGDGQSNYWEYVADTCPTSAASILAITNISLDAGALTIGWQGGSLATQFLERTDSLSDTNWVPVCTNIPPTAEGESHPAAVGTSTTGYYRIRVRR